MNDVEKNQIVEYLKKIILNEGIDYLSDNACKVYERLENINVKNGIRVAILSCLLNDVSKLSLKKKVGYDALYSYIKDNCLLNEEICADMANIFLEVFSNDNKKEYEDNKENGFEEFCNKEHQIEWKGFTRWYCDGVHVDCSFKANISFKIADKEKVRNDNLELLNKNPYLTADFFYKKYKYEITKEIDEDFEEYCTCDDYYEPNAEDYGVDCGEYTLQKYCDEHGLELISFEGEGDTSNYERN